MPVVRLRFRIGQGASPLPLSIVVVTDAGTTVACDFRVYVTSSMVEVAMDVGVDAKQTERVLSHLARMRHHGEQEGIDVLDSLRPAWLGVDAWDVVLEELETQHYRKRARVVQLRLVGA